MTGKISFNMNSINMQGQNQGVKSGKAQSIFLGNCNGNGLLSGESVVDHRKKVAGQQAMKLISDAWAKDNKRMDSIDKLRDLKSQKVDELREKGDTMKCIAMQRDSLMKEYGVDEDSEEMKELELLKKYQNNRMGILTGDFTDEEIEKLKSLQGTSRTEFQSRYLELNDAYNQYERDYDDLMDDLKVLTGNIAMQKNDLDASQDMLNAQNAAEDILDAASKEAMGLIMQEAKDNIDKTAEEEKEKAEEVKEKKEELQEKIDAAKERREEQEKIIEDSVEAAKLDKSINIETKDVSSVAEAQKSINKILKDNNLISDDIKGIEIDLGF